MLCFTTVKLKDPFPPARIAGINAFAATQQYYSLAETSSRVLPLICSLMVDPEKPVRDQAFKVIELYFDYLMNSNTWMPDAHLFLFADLIL